MLAGGDGGAARRGIEAGWLARRVSGASGGRGAEGRGVLSHGGDQVPPSASRLLRPEPSRGLGPHTGATEQG